MRIFIYCLLLVSLPLSMSAQQRPGALSGAVWVAGATDHSRDGYGAMENLTGATVRLITATRDTLYRTTNVQGAFSFKQIPQGKSILQVSFIGYQTRTDTVKVERNTMLQFINLKEEQRQIEEVVVKGKVPLMTMKGDTVIYNAAAVQTLAGDDAIRIVEQLPGAIMQDGVLKVHGEAISRSYVNGKLLFGADALTALNNLLASDVTKIRVYEEATDSDRRKGYVTGKKQKVLDVVTKTPILSSVTGHFLASAGADIDKGGDGSRRLRYGAGVTSNFFSELLLVSVNAFGNNIGRRSNRITELIENQFPQTSYQEDIVAEINVERYWKDRRDGSSIRGQYAFKDNTGEMLEVSRRRYFASESNPEMIYNDTTASNAHRYSHNAAVDFNFLGSKSKFLRGLRVDNRFSYETDKSHSSSVINTLTDRGMEYSNTQNQDRQDGYTIQEQVSWSGWGIPLSPSARVGATITKNAGAGWRVDSLSSTPDKRVLKSTSGDLQQRYDWELSLDLIRPRSRKTEGGDAEEEPKSTATLSMEYSGSYENTRNHKLSLNLNDEYNPVDITNSRDYSYHYLSHGIRANFGIGRWDDWRFNLRAGMAYHAPQKLDYFPVNYTYDKQFITPDLSLGLNRSSNGDFFQLSLSMRGSMPSIEQITGRINDMNPLLLSAGNPNLKAPQQYNFGAFWSNTIDVSGQMVMLSLTGNYTSNAITTRSRYFAEPTRLPEWENYLTQANATLSTYENVSGNARVAVAADYTFRIGRWATISSALHGQYGRSLAYVGDALSVTSTYSPSLTLGWNGVIAARLRYAVGSSVNYAFSENTVRNSSRNLGWNSIVKVDYEPLKWLFMGVFYSYQAQQFYTATGTDRTSHMLNAMLGLKAMKGMYTLSVSVYDMLNRGTTFESSMQSNYVLDSWKPSQGRYWLVNVGIKFNRKRSGDFNGMLNDGSTNGYGMIGM